MSAYAVLDTLSSGSWSTANTVHPYTRGARRPGPLPRTTVASDQPCCRFYEGRSDDQQGKALWACVAFCGKDIIVRGVASFCNIVLTGDV